MSRAAVAALALAGGACLITGTAQASNMGFKLERSFDVNRDGSGRALRNEYWVSYPLFNGLGDVGFHDATVRRCVDATNPLGDGVIDALDLLCDHWAARTTTTPGVFQIQYIDTATCSVPFIQGAFAGTRLLINGTTFPLIRDIGYQINVGAAGTQTPRNPAVIVGSHDPSYPGYTVAPSPACGVTAVNQTYLNLPYHTMFQAANEMLCGLINVDWVDTTPADGNPDTCFDDVNNVASGIFDNQVGAQHTIQVQTMPPSGIPDFRQVTRVSATRLQFSGNNYALIPGEAYKVVMGRQQLPATFLSPHF